ncbi:MAG TPA: choloylglycine hydrolase family protein, partial [Desulfomonilaceae bacterium]|nr:choloylglycine hydrolase family protein [Desulfomonilaceae bacterium]
GTVVIGRSNEFGIDANSQIVFEPAGKDFISKTPDGRPGKSWKARYAFLGINGLELVECFGEGMNEAGLSVEGLFFEESKYEAVDQKDTSNAVSSNDFVSWVLGNFGTIDELKRELPNVRVWGESVARLGGPLPLHFAAHDPSGKSIVIEFINGEKKVYDNPIGVMTNMPEFPWHITNLRNYLNLNAFIPKAKDFNGVSIQATGTGSGWLGIPGDWSPPSRFVRIACLVNTCSPAKDGKEALNLAKHILNTVDIALKSVEASIKGKTGSEAVVQEYTQWSVLLDLTNRVMYYYSYNDMNLKAIDLQKMAASKPQNAKVIPISGEFSATSVTDKLVVLK